MKTFIMPRLNPYLTFNGNCKEAMTWYQEILGGELTLMPVADSPLKDQMPEQYHHQMLHSLLKTTDFEIMATDMVPEAFVEGNTVQIALICKTDEEIHSLYEKLSAGGKAKQPLMKMFFGLIGTLEDRFGKLWLLELDKL